MKCQTKEIGALCRAREWAAPGLQFRTCALSRALLVASVGQNSVLFASTWADQMNQIENIGMLQAALCSLELAKSEEGRANRESFPHSGF